MIEETQKEIQELQQEIAKTEDKINELRRKERIKLRTLMDSIKLAMIQGGEIGCAIINGGKVAIRLPKRGHIPNSALIIMEPQRLDNEEDNVA